MTDPGTLSIRDFTYTLPEERIAKYPLAERDASKLLIYKEGRITEDIYKNIPDHIPADSLLVFNDTKVVEARLLFKKQTGGIIEIFCLEPHQQYADITTAMLQREKVLWHCMIGGASKWKHGQILEKKISHKRNELILHARYIEKTRDSFVIELSWNDTSLSFAEVLHLFGAIPLPPYIKREAEASDSERYQTVYAHYEGSVAAPTAGLHFTENVLKNLKEKHIDKDFVTLHVGAGTFKPVKSEVLHDHEMHAEHFTVSRSLIKNLIEHLDKKIVAVGTTSLRTLESLYWLGVKKSGVDSPESVVSQWEPYERKDPLPPAREALEFILDSLNQNGTETLTSKTQIIIAPGYRFRIVNGLITNFHQPQSTLLLLVAAFIGDKWGKVYDYALKTDFRFLSYGDGSLLWRDQA
ncbi:MAG TPA: S-adenosylmethionine:tRNA ribosyltransferase-isomerase [Chitinophagaceae bacterium]|nr:S-adenosylmethionine:tRNA ribosyltransferase-isomerase [Chitinophagaceae bacterium]